MDERLLEVINQMMNYLDEGDFMSAITLFESEARGLIESNQDMPNKEALQALNEITQYINEEDWQAALESVDVLRDILYG